MRSIKFSITFPEPLFKSIEQDRSRKKLNRSEFLQKMVNLFYEKTKEKKEIEKYVEAYKKHGEPTQKIDTRTMMGLESFNRERW
ncbi:MAG: hypothetical protein AUJ85_00160 [Elusimicrobia bacterium CG1_02_37_114]|nr:MAG: hypothetical protein AUJ85_00160 [Elusimicrobia bacterium CG1_02_37_114]PIV53719.1 MAG: hypothetical protein COS17_02395 [Elusimicrobia bacterium CG02_land_8_20_14_3_00_37_13]PIZ12886.1 MAG: hypothetical protein COY53_07700 [Elusimicrobia bacterium CG_4_10_14_0_8_um_filter_37_32]